MQSEIRSISDLEKALKEFRGQSTGRINPWWFRGQPKFGLEVQPQVNREWFWERSRRMAFALLRDDERKVWASEQTVLNSFELTCLGHTERGESRLDLYCLAQHYGLPTRLLDWSRSPLVALFYALCSESEDDVELIGINPRSLYRRDGLREIQLGRAEHIERAVDWIWRQEPDVDPGTDLDEVSDWVAVPFFPTLRDARMVNQQARFTFHPPGGERSISGDWFSEHSHESRRWRIPAASRPSLLGFVRESGIHEGLLTPGLAGDVAALNADLNLNSRSWEHLVASTASTDSPA